jgi:hypothetical protein
MVSKHTLSIRLTHQNHTKLVSLAKQRGVPVNTVLNLIIEGLPADTAPTPKPNSVRVSPEKPPVKPKIDYAAVVAEWADVPDADAPDADADDDDLPNFGS